LGEEPMAETVYFPMGRGNGRVWTLHIIILCCGEYDKPFLDVVSLDLGKTPINVLECTLG
jgi:hypothetical protein